MVNPEFHIECLKMANRCARQALDARRRRGPRDREAAELTRLGRSWQRIGHAAAQEAARADA